MTKAIFTIALFTILVFGWIMNIVKLIDCDFEPSYKSEIIRGVGIFVAPIGVVTGFMELKDEKTQTPKK